MNSDQIATIQSLETFSSSVSLLCILIVLYSLFLSPQRGRWTLPSKQLAILSLIDFFTTIFYAIGEAGSRNSGFCQFQAFMIQWGGLCNIFWVSAMAYHLYHWIALKKNEDKLNKKIKKSFLFSIFLSFFIAIVLLGTGVYGDATLWCWVKPHYDWVRFLFFYIILVIAWVYNIYILRKVGEAVSGAGPRLSLRKSARLSLAGTGVQHKIRQYLFVFIFIWFFGLLNRVVEAGLGHPVFVTSVLQALFVPLQGCFNSLVYGGLLIDFINFIKVRRRAKSEVSLSTPSSDSTPKKQKAAEGGENETPSPERHSDDKTHPSSDEESGSHGSQLSTRLSGKKPKRTSKKAITTHGLPVVPYTPRKVSIFISSFNQGEAPYGDLEDMSSWLVEGHDIYVIGVQECLCLDEFRRGMYTFLGGPEKFTMHTCEIGSNNTRLGFHGYIALTVFIPTVDIEKGFIKMTESSANDLANGTDLIVTTAANKGAVGLPFQIHDTSIGFVTVHLPSDSKGKSKLPRRNAAAQEMLREVVLASEDVGCDMQLLHDHLIILGDLNYRMNTPTVSVGRGGGKLGGGNVGEGQSALLSIANAAFAERSALGDDPHWIRRKYGLFYGPHSEMYLPKEERDLLLSAEKSAASAWDSVIQYDEMIEMMKTGEVFFGFQEVPPRFPPTYKRKKGTAGECGDYTSFSELVQGFSHTGEEPNDLDDMDDSTRSTSSLGSLSEVESFSGMPGVSFSGSVSPSSSGSEKDPVETKSLSGKLFGDVESGTTEQTEEKKEDILSSPLSSLPPLERRLSQSSLGSDLESGPPVPATAAPERPKPNRRGSMFNLRRGSVMGGFDEEKKKEEKRKSKLRPPSYTDRIIVHSLATENQKLIPEAYGFCDSYRASDHRPVCMTLTLEVNSSISPARTSADLDPTSSGTGTELSPYVSLLQLKMKGLEAIFINKDETTNNPLHDTPSLSPSLSLAENEDVFIRKEDISNSKALSKRMSNPNTIEEEMKAEKMRAMRHSADAVPTLSPSALPSGAPMERKKPQRRASMFPMTPAGPPPPPAVSEVVVIFPLPGKDPLLEYRKMYDFIKAFNVEDDSSVLSFLSHRNAKLKDELLKVRKSYHWKQLTGSHEVEVDSCVDVSLGVDALVKIIDMNGQEMGQAYLNLNPFLAPDRIDHPQHIQVPISSGGQYRGTLTGTFTLKCLHEQVTLG